MDTKLLKQKILDLAIRGKLVPQDPNDEPASVLLERIRTEKEQLIQQGKIKKPKTTSATDTQHYENIPFDIPESWAWVRLGDVATVVNGKNQKAVADDKGQYPIYGSGGIMGYANDFLCNENSTIIGRKGTINNPILVRTKFWNVDTAFGMEPSKGIDYLFFYYFCKGYNFKSLDKSTTLPSLTKANIEQIQIPIPPFAEQQRIVAEIERWFALIDDLEENKQDLQAAIRQTRAKVLDLAIHGKLVPQDPNDEPAIELLNRITPHYIPCDTSHYENLPQGWEVTTLENICKIISTQKYQIKQSNIKEAGKYPVISQSSNYIEGYSNEDDKLYKAVPVIVFGDHTRVVKFVDFEFVVGADGVKIFYPLLSQKYTYYLILYAASQIENKGYARHYSLLSKVPLFVSPLKEQRRIVNAIDELFDVIETISAEL